MYKKMLRLLFVSHYLRYHACFDRSKTSSLLNKCSGIEEEVFHILALHGQRDRDERSCLSMLLSVEAKLSIKISAGVNIRQVSAKLFLKRKYAHA